MHNDPQVMAEKLRVALELFDAAVAIQRQNLRRRNPSASDEEIEALLERWVSKRDEPLEEDPPWLVRGKLEL
jgi:uncharacterized protein YqeY